MADWQQRDGAGRVYHVRTFDGGGAAIAVYESGHTWKVWTPRPGVLTTADGRELNVPTHNIVAMGNDDNLEACKSLCDHVIAWVEGRHGRE